MAKMQCLSFNVVSFALPVIVFVLISHVNGKTPDFIKSCEDASTDCLRESLQATLPGFLRGAPELGIERMDPFAVNDLNLTLPGGLSVNFNQGAATGFRRCVVDKARLIKDNLNVQLHCNLTVKGKYRSRGRLLMFPIDGEGNSVIKCKNIRLVAIIKLGSKMQNSEKYLEIRSLNVNHQFEGKVSYQMTNLFKGSPEISNLVLEFMNRNWKLVAEEFGKPIVDFGVNSIMSSIKKFLRVVPMEDFVLAPMEL